MAQMNERDVDNGENERRSVNGGSFKFNVAAPEFVPTLAPVAPPPQPPQLPITGYFYPCFPSIDGSGGSWIYVADQEIAIPLIQSKINAKVGPAHSTTPQTQTQNQAKEFALPEELKLKIIKQVPLSLSLSVSPVSALLSLSLIC